jgi:hypothetical protein
LSGFLSANRFKIWISFFNAWPRTDFSKDLQEEEAICNPLNPLPESADSFGANTRKPNYTLLPATILDRRPLACYNNGV